MQSCFCRPVFDAKRLGLFEPLFWRRGWLLFSDALNHASIIDAFRLCKRGGIRYAIIDMARAEAQLKRGRDEGGAIHPESPRMVCFSMDGTLAQAV